MSYLGQAALKNSELKRFDVTSSTSATHVLSWTAPNEQSLWITINGVKQQDDAYSIAGSPTTITLTDALVATDKMEVIGVVDIGVITIVGDNSVSSNKLADNAVTTGKILDGTIVAGDLANLAVTDAKLATGIDAVKLADGSVTNTELQYINTVSSNVQTQINAKGVGDALLGSAQTFTAGQRGEVTALTSALQITINLADSNNYSVTLDHNATFENPTNAVAGQSGSIFITQGSTGGTGSWAANWDWAAGTAPTLTTTAAAVDRIDYVVRSATSIQAVATLALA
jgi:hypothetical protein|tara:strand:+ start:819 stop:1673 length:855 start_codon:yes stop_codon:yes gene_type:complete